METHDLLYIPKQKNPFPSIPTILTCNNRPQCHIWKYKILWYIVYLPSPQWYICLLCQPYPISALSLLLSPSDISALLDLWCISLIILLISLCTPCTYPISSKLDSCPCPPSFFDQDPPLSLSLPLQNIHPINLSTHLSCSVSLCVVVYLSTLGYSCVQLHPCR